MDSKSTSVAAFVFDAYGTLFDVHSLGALAEALAPGHGSALSHLWRGKQLEYTWLTSLMGPTAAQRDDFAPFEELVTVLSKPYDDQPQYVTYMDPPQDDERVTQTFCGT